MHIILIQLCRMSHRYVGIGTSEKSFFKYFMFLKSVRHKFTKRVTMRYTF